MRRHRSQVGLIVVGLIVSLLAMNCGGFIGNPKKPDDDDQGETTSVQPDDPVVIFESSDVNLLGARVLYDGSVEEAPKDLTLALAEDVLSEDNAAILGLPEGYAGISPALSVTVNGTELPADILAKVLVTMPVSGALNEEVLASMIVAYSFLGSDGSTRVGYITASLFFSKGEEIFNSSAVTVGLKAMSANYQVLVLTTVPPQQQNEVSLGDVLLQESPCKWLKEFSYCESHAEGSLFDNGAGTEEDPYIVCSFAQFRQVRENLSAFYRQGASIDAANSAGSTGGFAPIGSLDDAFTGRYEGCDHQISNLTINRPDEDHVGVFGAIGPTGSVDYLKLKTASISGRNYVGGIAGVTCGKLREVYLEGDVTGQDFVGAVVGQIGANNDAALAPVGPLDCTGSVVDKFKDLDMGTGTVTGQDFVGGVAGAFFSGGVNSFTAVLDDSRGEMIVIGRDYVGGAIGLASGAVSDVTVGKTISGRNNVGGVIGSAVGALEYRGLRHAGSVTGTGENAGGIIGYAEGGAVVSGGSSVGPVTGVNHVGGAIGQGDTATLSQVLALGDVTGTKNIGGIVGTFRGVATQNESQFADCFFRGRVIGTAFDDGVQYLGGLIGDADSSQIVERCYLAADIVAGSTVPADHKEGNVVGNATSSFRIGSIFYDSSFDNAAGPVGASDNLPAIDVTGVEQKTTTELWAGSDLYTAAGWDFDRVWKAIAAGYPELRVHPGK